MLKESSNPVKATVKSYDLNRLTGTSGGGYVREILRDALESRRDKYMHQDGPKKNFFDF